MLKEAFRIQLFNNAVVNAAYFEAKKKRAAAIHSKDETGLSIFQVVHHVSDSKCIPLKQRKIILFNFS